MTKYRTIRTHLERTRDLLDVEDQLDLHVQAMLDTVIETVLTLECAKRPCEIIAFPVARRLPPLDA